MKKYRRKKHSGLLNGSFRHRSTRNRRRMTAYNDIKRMYYELLHKRNSAVQSSADTNLQKSEDCQRSWDSNPSVFEEPFKGPERPFEEPK